MNNIFIVEDHDTVLKIWKKKNIQNLDLVHLDAHIDLGIHLAKPLKKILEEAEDIKELKEKLEYAISYLHYAKDFKKQIDIGNYIYPAIKEDIVRDFYWVIPGGIKEFKSSFKLIKNILRDILKEENKNEKLSFEYLDEGLIVSSILGRRFFVSILEKLPNFNKEILLDIDTDFLVIDTLKKADNTQEIGKRRPWILPKDLSLILKKKITRPKIITIAYSVNGGFTPINYRYFADELAYQFSNSKFKKRLFKKYKATRYFLLFNSTGKKEFYWKAVSLDRAFRLPDNNYGPLYLIKNRFLKAQEEFKRILKVDKDNFGSLVGMAQILLRNKDFKRAKRFFLKALRLKNKNDTPIHRLKERTLFGLAKIELKFKKLNKAKNYLISLKNNSCLEPEVYYLLGLILEKEKKYILAVQYYKDAIRLGFNDILPLKHLIKITKYLKQKDDIIKYINYRYRTFKNNFLRLERAKKRIKGLNSLRQKLLDLEKSLIQLNKSQYNNLTI